MDKKYGEEILKLYRVIFTLNIATSLVKIRAKSHPVCRVQLVKAQSLQHFLFGAHYYNPTSCYNRQAVLTVMYHQPY